MKRTLRIILLSFSFLFVCFFLTNDGLALCFNWGDTTCADPSRIPVCNGGDCTIEGGITIIEQIVPELFSEMTISEYITTVVRYFLSFVTLIAVLYVIYAGFRLMTSGGDEEQGKKSRRIIIYVLIGIVIMWAAYWIVRIVIGALNRPLALTEPLEILARIVSYI